jgi:hypothetical protein
MTRHAWLHPAPHRYLCRHCGLEKRNLAELQPGGRSVWRVEYWQGAVLVATGQTPPCPGAPLPDLTWSRVSPYCWDAHTGHRVSVTRHEGQLLYSAWGPDNAPGEYWPKNALAHYAQGAAMPTRRAWLGTFRAPELARQACARDAGERNGEQI